MEEGHGQGWSFSTSLVCPLLPLTGQQLQNGTGGGPHSQTPWVMHSPVAEARGTRWERLLLFVTIGFNHGRQNPNESLTR